MKRDVWIEYKRDDERKKTIVGKFTTNNQTPEPEIIATVARLIEGTLDELDGVHPGAKITIAIGKAK